MLFDLATGRPLCMIDGNAFELGDLLAGRAELQREPADITLFDLTGLALQELTVARLIHRRAMELGIGTSVPWPW